LKKLLEAKALSRSRVYELYKEFKKRTRLISEDATLVSTEQLVKIEHVMWSSG
jgi:hypothetical protein